MHHTDNNGEVGTAPQQKEKQKSNKDSKKSKRSLSRRVRYIFTSPVHLFRRYVLRKSPKKKIKELEGDDETNNTPEAVEIAKQRNIPCYLLFLGLKQSGKSTTISKTFNCRRAASNDENPTINIYKNRIVGQSIGLKVVDTPGFCGSALHDTKIVTALSAFLRRDLPQRIPTVTFIVARLDDEDDVGEAEQSRFTHMLQSLSRVESLFTDQLYSNIVLLLTHSQRAINVSSRISKYQAEFSKTFPVKCPIHVMAIDNIRRKIKPEDKLQNYHTIIFEGLKEFSEKRQDYSFHTLLYWLMAKAKRFSVSFEQRAIQVGNLPKEYLPIVPLECVKPPQNCEPYFVMHHHKDAKKWRKSQRKNNEQNFEEQQVVNKLQTCIAPGSQIVLADKSMLTIDKCLIGDKLLGLQGTCSVITGIQKTTLEHIASQCKSIGHVYCSLKQENGRNEEKVASTNKFIYTYNNSVFELADATKANAPEQQTTEDVYLLELDSPNGTFILNGFVCYATTDFDPNKSTCK